MITKCKFLWGPLVSGILAGALAAYLIQPQPKPGRKVYEFESDFGFWLAAQHAAHINDFGRVAKFLSRIEGDAPAEVRAVRALAMFFDSGDVSEVEFLIRDGASGALSVINAAVLARDGKWREMSRVIGGDTAAFWTPLRIWALVGSGQRQQALRFIDSVPRATDAWKNFQKGAVNAATRNPRTARNNFQAVPVSFLNLSDYHLVLSFYNHFGFKDEAAELSREWLANPGAMYMANIPFEPDWSRYDTHQKMIAAGMIQKVSHGGQATHNDAGLLGLRIASMLGGDPVALDYYLGLHFFRVNSDLYKRYWNRVLDNPIYGPFVRMKIAEKAGNKVAISREISKLLRDVPLFLPAMQVMWRIEMAAGRDVEMLRVLNRALSQAEDFDMGQAFLLRLRAHTFYLFGELIAADDDLEKAADLAPLDAGIMGMRARVWARQGENLDEAYRYAISLIRAFPATVENWGILALVVQAKEGDEPALALLERVARIAETSSELFMILGDIRMSTGDTKGAIQAWERSLTLTDDGLVIESEVRRRIRNASGRRGLMQRIIGR